MPKIDYTKYINENSKRINWDDNLVSFEKIKQKPRKMVDSKSK